MNISLLNYFAAHAPARPEGFTAQGHSQQGRGIADLQAEWAFHYAEWMIHYARRQEIIQQQGNPHQQPNIPISDYLRQGLT